MKTAKDTLTEMGWNLSETTIPYFISDNIIEFDVNDEYLQQVNIETGESRHKGYGNGCFWTEWEV